jgi:hypothetical protein
MLIAGENNRRFFTEIKLRKCFTLPTTFITMTMAKNKYGGLYAPRHDAAI